MCACTHIAFGLLTLGLVFYLKTFHLFNNVHDSVHFLERVCSLTCSHLLLFKCLPAVEEGGRRDGGETWSWELSSCLLLGW